MKESDPTSIPLKIGPDVAVMLIDTDRPNRSLTITKNNGLGPRRQKFIVDDRRG